MICRYFLPFLEFPFLSVDRVIWYTSFWFWWKKSSVLILLLPCPGNQCQNSCHEAFIFFPPSSFYVFMILTLLGIFLKSILSIWCKVKVQPTSLFCIWISTFHSCWKNCPCPCACSWHPCQNSFDHICEGLFVDSLFHWPMCLSLCQYHTLDYCCIVVNFKIRKCEISNFGPPFQGCFGL